MCVVLIESLCVNGCVFFDHHLYVCPDQPIPVQHSAVKGVAKFDFTGESDDELTLKVSVCACARARVCVCWKGNSVKITFTVITAVFR